MVTRSIFLASIDTGVISLGYQGENAHTQIAINCSSIFTDYPSADVSIIVKSPTGVLYEPEVTKSGNVVTWVIVSEDTASPGNGAMQLTFTSGTEIIKSAIATTSVSPSIVWDA